MCDYPQSLPYKGPSNLAEWWDWFSGLVARHLTGNQETRVRIPAEHIFTHFLCCFAFGSHHTLLYIYKYLWIFENGANVNTTTPTLFQENTQDFFFNQPQTTCQHTAYSPTLLVSGWLAGLQPISQQGTTAPGIPAWKIKTFSEQKASFCDPPHPQGINPGTPLGINW